MWVPAACLPLFAALLRPAESLLRPNIVFLLADDLGYNDVGHHGGEIPTPNIDALGFNGVIFNRHYSQPTCTPSRAALLTGKYPMRLGMQGKPIGAGTMVGLPLNETILPEYLAELGYKSHLVGKWHLGSYKKDFLPTNRGFDTHFGYWNGYIGHYDGIHASLAPGYVGIDMHRGEDDAWAESYGKHITELLTNEAVERIRGHEEEGGLFLLLAHSAPHTGNIGNELASPPTTLDEARRNNITDPKRRIYADMVKALDDSVGRIVETLAEEGKLHNTIITFVSDNGAPSVDELWGFDNYGSNWPLRGIKCSAHEGGVRTSAVMWSSALENPGRVYNNIFHISDWLPTLFSAAGSKLNVGDMDGIDHWKRLLTGEGSPPRKSVLLDIEDWGAEAILNGKWKLIRDNPPGHEMAFADRYFGASGRGIGEYNVAEVKESLAGKLTKGRSNGDYLRLREEAMVDSFCSVRIESGREVPCNRDHCLFDLSTDPCESHDLAKMFPHVVSEMKTSLLQYRMVMVPKKTYTIDPKAIPKDWGNRWVPWLDATSEGSMFLPKLVGIFPTIYALLQNTSFSLL